MFAFHPSYTPVAKFLHWLIALGIIAMLVMGWVMTDMENSPNKFALFQLHKSVGITILLLTIIRLWWRIYHKPPQLPALMPEWEKLAAVTAHFCFYVLLILMPLTGWIIVSSSPLNMPTILYGLIPWPHLPVFPDLQNKKEISDLFGAFHSLLAYVIAGLAVLHILAAWKHHLIDRDDILLRMAPRFMHPLLNKIRGH